MRTAELLWAPWPYRAGFCITDDTDAATLASVRAVYDVLAALGIRVSKTVWAFKPTEPCGIPPLPDSIQRGITCEDPDYLAYCVSLRERGFEICLHGASAGNNRRERTAAGLEFLERHFGGAGTWICHAKNAENIYWHEKVAPRGPARWLLAPASRYQCSGEDPASPYFWGDLCRERVEHIRLFRTRNINTLADNPSMPYHDPEKPFVRSWFSATKRSFRDCTSPEALAGLVAERGLCVLYHYLHRYEEGAGTVKASFRQGAERLAAAREIWTDTTSAIMRRRRAMAGVFVGVRGDAAWLANAGEVDATDVQVALPSAAALAEPAEGVTLESGVARIRRVPAGAMVRLPTREPLAFPGAQVVRLDGEGRGERPFGFGRVALNAGVEPWARGGDEPISPGGCRAEFGAGFETLKPFSRPGRVELHRLLAGQLGIIAHEVLFKRRSLDSRRFLGAQEILLEDQDSW
jgi:hypothetical protein